MRVVVTGGAGFLGAHVVDLLEEHGHEPIVLDDLSTGNRDRLGSGVQFIEADVRDTGAFHRTLSALAAESLVHLAARPFAPREPRPDKSVLEANLNIAMSGVVASRLARVPHFVFASTAAVYGDLQGSIADEEHATRPRSPNGKTKLLAEDFLKSMRDGGGTAVLRFANLYGPGSSSACESAVHAFMESMSCGEPPRIDGTGNQTRDFVFVRDAARAVVASVESKLFGTFNVGTGVETSVRELATMVATALGVPALHPQFLDPRPHEVRRSCLEGSRLFNAVGFRPGTVLRHGLLGTVASHRPTLLRN